MWINNVGNISAFIVIPARLSEHKKEVQKVDNESNSKNTVSDEEEVRIKKQNEEAIFSMFDMRANVNKFVLGL